MHPHTKQWLDKFEKTKLYTQGGSCWECCEYEDMVEEMADLFQQALLSQAEMIRAEMVPEHREIKKTETLDLRTKKFGFNNCVENINANLDELINSFK